MSTLKKFDQNWIVLFSAGVLFISVAAVLKKYWVLSSSQGMAWFWPMAALFIVCVAVFAHFIFRAGKNWLRSRQERQAPVAAYALAAIFSILHFFLTARLNSGDLMNSYPFISNDGFDYIVEGHYLKTLLTEFSVDLGEFINAQGLFPREPGQLHVLRNPGFVIVMAIDALLGGTGFSFLAINAGFVFLTIYFLLKTLEHMGVSASGLVAAVLIAFLSPLGDTRSMVLSDVMTTALLQGSVYYFARGYATGDVRMIPRGSIYGLAAVVTQTYGLIPLLCYGLVDLISSLFKRLRSKDPWKFFGWMIEKIADQRWPLAAIVSFIFITILWRQIPHLSLPPWLSNINFSAAMIPFYLNLYGFVFLPLAPAVVFGVFLSVRHGQRWGRLIVYTLTITVTFVSLLIFYHVPDSRFTYAFFLTAVITIFALLYGARDAISRMSKIFRTCLLFGGVAAIATQTFFMSLYPASYTNPGTAFPHWDAHNSWMISLVKMKPLDLDRMSLLEKCGSVYVVCPQAKNPGGDGYSKSMFTDYIKLRNQ